MMREVPEDIMDRGKRRRSTSARVLPLLPATPAYFRLRLEAHFQLRLVFLFFLDTFSLTKVHVIWVCFGLDNIFDYVKFLVELSLDLFNV